MMPAVYADGQVRQSVAVDFFPAASKVIQNRPAIFVAMADSRQGTRLVAAAEAGQHAAPFAVAIALADRLGVPRECVAVRPPGTTAPRELRGADGGTVPVVPGLLDVEAVRRARHASDDIVLLHRDATAAGLPLRETVLRRASGPVLFVTDAPLTAGPIVAALSGEPRGAAVWRLAEWLARRLDVEPVAVTVRDQPWQVTTPFLDDSAERVMHLLDRIQPGGALAVAPVVAVQGDFGTALAAVAAERGAALVLVGRRHGSTGGAHAAAALRAWPGPVMVVPI